MKNALLPVSVLGLASLAATQGPCLPSNRLATMNPLRSTHYSSVPGQNNSVVPPIPQNLPATYRGYQILFDLEANTAVAVDRIDMLLSDDGDIRFNWGPAPGVPGGPGLVGQTASVKVYTTPNTWTGKSTLPAEWTLLGTGTLTVAPHLERSSAVFTTPVVLPVGTYGVTIELGPVTDPVPALQSYMAPLYALHPEIVVLDFARGSPATVRDQFLTITNQNRTTQSFVVAPTPDPKVAVFELHYSVAPDAGFSTGYGAGCYDEPRSFYETYTSPSAFDLANTTLRFAPTGSASYLITPVPTTEFRMPTTPRLLNAANAALGDDDRTGTLLLGFSFPYAGTSTSSISVFTNGGIFLDPANSGSQRVRFEALGVGGFLVGPPMLAPMWGDLNPSTGAGGGGGLHLEVDLNAPVPVAYVTWLNVPEFRATSGSNNFQVALFADGRIEYRYGACAVGGRPTMVGWTPGNTRDPGPRDLSNGVFYTGSGAVPPQLGMDRRPALGSAPNLMTRDLGTAAFGAVFIGGPSSLLPLPGMPGCMQQVAPIGALFFATAGSVGSVPLPIPNHGSLLGLSANCQSLVPSPGANPAGLLVSSPMCLKIGAQ